MNIIINAHVDGWFDGGNDNGDGLAVMAALAEHFSKPENRPARTLVFVGSAGHHTGGLSGPDQLVGLNKELIARNVLAINLEHVAVRQLNPARTDTNGLRDYITDAGENFLMNGLSERSPFLEGIIREGGLRYGLNFVSAASTYGAGDNPDVDGPLLSSFRGIRCITRPVTCSKPSRRQDSSGSPGCGVFRQGSGGGSAPRFYPERR